MSDFTVVIENTEPNIVSIETSFIDNIGLVEIERFGAPSVNILRDSSMISVSDLPDIPFTKITGFVDVARISGLDDYLNSYTFDGGTP